jgi:hypothetical protein
VGYFDCDEAFLRGAQDLARRRLLLQRLGKVPPRLGEFAGALFELRFQLDQ